MSLAMTATCQAMQQILQLHLPGNLAAENSQLRAENARLQAEVQQLRAAAISQYRNNADTRNLTWREFAAERNQNSLRVRGKIREAANRIRLAIYEVLVYMDEVSGHNETRLNNAHCSMVQIRNFLEEDEDMVQIRNFLEQEEQAEEEGAEEAEEEDAEEEEQP